MSLLRIGALIKIMIQQERIYEKPILIIDFDSTIVQCETLDILTKDEALILDKIKAITNAAMSGQKPFGQALKERLQLINLSQKNFDNAVQVIKSQLSPSFSRFVYNLDEEQRERLFIVSGGFVDIIVPVCQAIIPINQIFANTLKRASTTVELDVDNPLSQNQGKIKIIHQKIYPLFPNAPLIIIGDGYTDLEIKQHYQNNPFSKEVKQPTIFMAYIENITRPGISSQADYVVKNFDEVAAILSKI